MKTMDVRSNDTKIKDIELLRLKQYSQNLSPYHSSNKPFFWAVTNPIIGKGPKLGLRWR